jgi:hypothetical protein
VSDDKTETAVLIGPAAVALRDRFIGWQCRLRQLAVRESAGRPSPGMCPRVLSAAGEELAAAMTVLIVPNDPAESTKLFQYQVLRTQDPVERYDKAQETLAAGYFQHPREFSDVMTALFAAQSGLADVLRNLGQCRLVFEQHRHNYRVPCGVLEYAEGDQPFQATYWHNRLYNSNLPAVVHVLGFQPDWSHASFQMLE